MKRCIIIALLLCFLPLCTYAQAEALYPAKAENGLYGYINEAAEWVIAPQWPHAYTFRGNYALVSNHEGDYWNNDNWYTEGVIDKQGNLLTDCSYFFDSGYDGWCYGGIDTGIWVVWTDDAVTDKWGYFDIPSGYFSGLIYDSEIRCWGNSSLMPVVYQGETWYVRRSTGELVIGPVTVPEYCCDPPHFFDGFAPIQEDAGTYSFLSMDGNIVTANPAYDPYPYNCYFGLCPVENKETGLWGYLSMATGEIAIDAVYTNTDPFSYEGYACVQLADGTYGHIDVDGNLIAGGFLSGYTFSRGYAYIEDQGILINTEGETVFTVPQGYRLESFNLYNDQPDDIFYVTDNNLVVLYAAGDTRGTGFMNLDGQWVIPPEYGFSNEDYLVGNYTVFANGVQAMWKWSNGHFKSAYFDETGKQLTDFIYDEAGAFYQGGLARVWRDNLTGYINLQGKEVYMWEE